jgi:hypothetical protein
MMVEKRAKRILSEQGNPAIETQATPAELTTAQMIERLWAEMPTKRRVIAKRGDTVLYGDYVELPQVLRRLQEVYGMDYAIGFSPPNFYEKTVAVRAVVVAGDTRVEGYGTAPIRNGDVETAIKSAETDAVKRACRYLGIGAFLYEKGLTESNGGTETATPTAPSKGKPARATKATANGTEELPNLPNELRNAVEQAFRAGMGEDDITFEEGYNYLRKYASAKQANTIVRYPDLVEEFCDRLYALEDDSDIRRMVSEIVSLAIERIKAKEDWREYYDYDADDYDEDPDLFA